MKAYVKPAIMVEEPITFETAHSDPHGNHYHPNEPTGKGLGHYGCWIKHSGHWNN